MKRSIVTRGITAFMLGVLVPLSSVATSFAATPTDIYTATDKAIAYLSAQQQPNGGIAGYGGESDWTAIALSANGGDASTFQLTNGTSLADFVSNEATPTSTTGIERKLLALTALKADTTTLKATLVAKYDGTQLGDAAYLNDDIFGILAIAATNDSSLYSIAQSSLNYVIAHQDPATGGFSSCADITQQYCGVDSNDTASAIVALQVASTIGLTNTALQPSLALAEKYLISSEQSDGGFAAYDTNGSPSDGDSTAWAAIAFNTIGDTTHADSAKAWMLANQNTDGGFGYVAYHTPGSDTYTTPNAVLALLGTNWLLSPAPISRPAPVVQTPPPAPVPTPTPAPTPAPAPVTSPVVTPVATTATVATPYSTSSDTSAPSTDTLATDNSNGTVEGASTTTPVDTTAQDTTAASASLPKTPTKQPQTSTVAHTIGISLIALATIGLIAYGLIIRRRRVQ